LGERQGHGCNLRIGGGDHPEVGWAHVGQTGDCVAGAYEFNGCRSAGG